MFYRLPATSRPLLLASLSRYLCAQPGGRNAPAAVSSQQNRNPET
jgi:hypothetical protein